MGKKVVVYSAIWCPWCRQALEYLDSLGMEYELRDTDIGAFADELLARSGQSGIPVLDIDGKIIIGFDPARIDDALSARRKRR